MLEAAASVLRGKRVLEVAVCAWKGKKVVREGKEKKSCMRCLCVEWKRKVRRK